MAKAIEKDFLNSDLNLSDDSSSNDTDVNASLENTSLQEEWLNTLGLLNTSIKVLTSNQGCITKDNLVLLLDAASLVINITPSK